MGTPDHIRTDAHARLERFATEWLCDRFPETIGSELGIAPLDRAGLREAAETVMAEVQAELVDLHSRIGAEPLDGQTARRLGRDRYRALLALLEVARSHKDAKQTQLRITEGEPLAICTGDAFRIHMRRERILPTPYVTGGLRFSVKGCNRIFPDAITMVGAMWPTFCPDCRNNSRRKPARDQKRALNRRIHSAMSNPTIYVGVPPEAHHE